MNLMVVFSLVGLLVILLLGALIILLFKNNSEKENRTTNNNHFSTRTEIDIKRVEMPKKIVDMGPHLLFQSCLKVFDSFKALDYAKKDERYLDVVEWHMWQVSMLLALLQSEKNIFIPNPNKVFHSTILQLNKNQLKSEIQRIFKKYLDNINLNRSRDDLREEIIWSCRDVSIIFYYMTLEDVKNNNIN